MKKIILGLITFAFIATPAFAKDFQVQQTVLLNNLTMEMEKVKDDAVKIEQLTQTKACVENATDLDGLKECLSNTQSE